MKTYDRDYFQRWYHDPATKIAGEAELRRRIAMVLGLAEYLLQREVRTVLDVGCGEGSWQPILKSMRPKLRYTGIDSSEYAVAEYGRSRNLRLGTFGTLGEQNFDGGFDLVLCVDMLHYLAAAEIDRGLPELARLTEGIAYVALFTEADEPAGDLAGWQKRTGAWYRKRFEKAGLLPCGMQCYVTSASADLASELELS